MDKQEYLGSVEINTNDRQDVLTVGVEPNPSKTGRKYFVELIRWRQQEPEYEEWFAGGLSPTDARSLAQRLIKAAENVEKMEKEAAPQ